MRINELKKVRVLKGLTQLEVAKKSHIAVRTYQNYENCIRIPDIETAQRISIALETPVEILFPISAATGGKSKTI